MKKYLFWHISEENLILDYFDFDQNGFKFVGSLTRYFSVVCQSLPVIVADLLNYSSEDKN